MSNVSVSDTDAMQPPTTPTRPPPPPSLTYKDFTEYQLSLILWKTCPPIIFLVGGFGNVATIFVMRQIKDHNSSQHALLTALAVSDLTFLCMAVPFEWLPYAFQISLREAHVVLCKLYSFLQYGAAATSAWLVTCVTVQRALAVLWPHRMRAMCSGQRTRAVIAAVVLFACALYSHLLFKMHITSFNWCFFTDRAYADFFFSTFIWINLCVSSFLPSVVMIVCDVILSVSLFRAVSVAAAAAAASSSSSQAAHSADSRRKTSSRTTVLVLAVSCTFLLLTLPVFVHLVWDTLISAYKAHNPRLRAVAELSYSLTHQLWFTNSAVNFGLYCLTGTKFRREFLRWIRCGGAQSGSPSVQETERACKREGRQTGR